MANIQTIPFDSLALLETDEDIVEYLNATLEDGDPVLIAASLGDIARKRGMRQVAQATGVGPESLYKTLFVDRNPDLATVMRMVNALHLRLHATAEK